ncbi:MAG: M28 family metallopeptidase [Promethearchaeota archaeon]
MNLGKPTQMYSFDKEKIINYVKKFSFPRLAGTEGEKKAVDLAIKTFKNIGFEDSQIQTQNFDFSDFYSTTLIKLIMVINLTFSLFLLMFIYINIYITILVVGAFSLLVFLIIKGLRHPEYPGFWDEYYGETHNATNVFVKIPAKNFQSESAGNVIISAHLDSKSQTFRTYWRVFLYKVWLYSGIFLGGFLIALFIRTFTILNPDLLIIIIGIWTFTTLISISNIFLMFLNTHNKSPGALDNASGMSIVFELSTYFKNDPLENFNLWFCQFSAEELGTMGSRVFVNKYENQFVKGRIFQFNSDMVSCANHKKNQIQYLKSYGVLPRKKIAPLLSKYLDKASNKKNLKIFGFHLSSGAHSDSVAFHLRGYDSVDITTRIASRYAHNKEDTPDKVDPQKLLETCVIIKEAILMLDKDFQMLCKNQELICDTI